MKPKTLFYAMLALAGIVLLAGYRLIEHQRHRASLATRIEQIIRVGNQPEVPCAEAAASRPLVLLALGQSNAGNHGSPSSRTAEAITLLAEEKCIKASDPLPGGTGTGGSIWQRLPAALSSQGNSHPVVLSVQAVDATAIADWTNPDSPLGERLATHIESMRRQGLTPTLVLWQQGEADAQAQTGANGYAAGLKQLAAMLDKAGVKAPIVLAQSTVCHSPPNAAIRSAIEMTLADNQRFRRGPDTDTLSGETLRNGCHLTAEGLDSAAKMWATTINAEAPAAASMR